MACAVVRQQMRNAAQLWRCENVESVCYFATYDRGPAISCRWKTPADRAAWKGGAR